MFIMHTLKRHLKNMIEYIWPILLIAPLPPLPLPTARLSYLYGVPKLDIKAALMVLEKTYKV